MIKLLIGKKDRYLIVEILSAITFIIMSLFIWFADVAAPDTRPPLFWILLLAITGVLQGSSLFFIKHLVALRIFMAWIVGSAFLWIAYVNIYNVLVVPMLVLGIVNFVAFIEMCNRAKFEPLQDLK